jgi:hypothetical protein
MSRLYFFATGADALLFLAPLEMELDVQYVEENRLVGPVPQRWKRADQVPGFGCASGDQEILCMPLLIMADSAEVVVAFTIMTDGDTRYDVYQSNNPESVLIRLGGMWQDGSLISGHLIGSSEKPFARKIMNAVRKGIRRSFVKVSDYWVGPEVSA